MTFEIFTRSNIGSRPCFSTFNFRIHIVFEDFLKSKSEVQGIGGQESKDQGVGEGVKPTGTVSTQTWL